MRSFSSSTPPRGRPWEGYRIRREGSAQATSFCHHDVTDWLELDRRRDLRNALWQPTSKPHFDSITDRLFNKGEERAEMATVMLVTRMKVEAGSKLGTRGRTA